MPGFQSNITKRKSRERGKKSITYFNAGAYNLFSVQPKILKPKYISYSFQVIFYSFALFSRIILFSCTHICNKNDLYQKNRFNMERFFLNISLDIFM